MYFIYLLVNAVCVCVLSFVTLLLTHLMSVCECMSWVAVRCCYFLQCQQLSVENPRITEDGMQLVCKLIKKFEQVEQEDPE